MVVPEAAAARPVGAARPTSTVNVAVVAREASSRSAAVKTNSNDPAAAGVNENAPVPPSNEYVDGSSPAGGVTENEAAEFAETAVPTATPTVVEACAAESEISGATALSETETLNVAAADAPHGSVAVAVKEKTPAVSGVHVQTPPETVPDAGEIEYSRPSPSGSENTPARSSAASLPSCTTIGDTSAAAGASFVVTETDLT